MDFKDYYNTLGLGKKASEKEVKSAFKKLAKQYHPDSQTGSEEKFKELNEAYEVLGDKTKRERYDYMHGQVGGGAADNFANKSQAYKQKMYTGGYNNYQEFFRQKEQELRKKQAEERQKSKQKYEKKKEREEGNFSDFFEMFFGQQKEKANVKDKEAEAKKAPSRGEDFEMEIQLNLEDAYHGTVRKIEISGANQTIRRLEVSIPPGVRSSTKIKVANEGKPGKHGGANGDLYLVVKLEEHDEFWLDGDDVHSDLKILPFEAVLGTEKRIKTLEGFVELVIPPKSHHDRILRLRDKGMKNSKGETMGDHYVHIAIDIQHDFTDEEVKSYQYLKELYSRK